MVFSDPPYNVKIDGHASGLGRMHHPEFMMASGEMSGAEFASFLTLACAQLARNSLDGSIHFICMDWGHAGELITAGRTAYSELKNICVWVKHNAGMGSFYRSQHELVFVFKAGRGPHRNNVQLGNSGGIGPMCGLIPVPTRLAEPPTKAICWRCTLPSSRFDLSPTRSWIAPFGATLFSILSWAAERP
jgi:hypothetical protein